MTYTIKTATREEVDHAVAWAAKEGWNPGYQDAECYFAADPTGFLIGYLSEEPIASISVVKYSDSFGFLGFYIVKPEHRGKGHGLEIWQAGLDYLAGCSVGLDGVVAQQDNYKKSGFKLAFRNVRYEGVGGGVNPGDGIINLASLPWEMVEEYDRPFFPANRSEFLKRWINQPNSVALGIQKDDELAGYGVMRKCLSGYKIGPLFADSPELAERLFLALKSHASSADPVFLDTPEVNTASVQLAKTHNMKVVFETARMYRGNEPQMPLDRIFGITSFEIG